MNGSLTLQRDVVQLQYSMFVYVGCSPWIEPMCSCMRKFDDFLGESLFIFSVRGINENLICYGLGLYHIGSLTHA